MLYDPVHNVVIAAVVPKLVIDWAAQPRPEGGNHRDILLLGCAQLASMLLLRWGNMAYITNRGRTGGVRMTHRMHLLEKLIMLCHEQQWEVGRN